MSYLAEPPTPKFRTAEWEQKYGDCNCDDVSSAQGAQTRRNAFNSLRLLETLSELIQREPQLERALKKVDPCKPQCEANGLPHALKQRLFKQVGEALPLMREEYVWEGGEVLDNQVNGPDDDNYEFRITNREKKEATIFFVKSYLPITIGADALSEKQQQDIEAQSEEGIKNISDALKDAFFIGENIEIFTRIKFWGNGSIKSITKSDKEKFIDSRNEDVWRLKITFMVTILSPESNISLTDGKEFKARNPIRHGYIVGFTDLRPNAPTGKTEPLSGKIELNKSYDYQGPAQNRKYVYGKFVAHEIGHDLGVQQEDYFDEKPSIVNNMYVKRHDAQGEYYAEIDNVRLNETNILEIINRNILNLHVTVD